VFETTCIRGSSTATPASRRNSTCATEPSTTPADGETRSANDALKESIYFDLDDPEDPYREVYADFRARRIQDMGDPDLPPPVPWYPATQFTRDMPWSKLEDVLRFDWTALRAASPDAVASLEMSAKARLAFDHPDVKIVQWMLGPGALLPSHATGAPGVYIVIGGEGEITREGETQRVEIGSTVKLEPYDVRRVQATGDAPLKLLWIRWAPGGDQSYLAAGYYLTGANAHIQPDQADMPGDYLFWDAVYATTPVDAPATPVAEGAAGSFYAAQASALANGRQSLGDERVLYPGVPAFGHESDHGWLSAETLKKGGFFFSKDAARMTAIVDRMIEIARHKAVFRASRPDGTWDYNISQSSWGPRSTYVEHSHLTPEFYYMMSGPVLYGVDDKLYRVMPGDVLYNNSYSPHLAQGIVDGMPFDNFGSSWPPNGDHSVYERPAFLVEPLPEQPESARLPEDASFH
jgi:quercetin dioxygenase-like cupin family protein